MVTKTLNKKNQDLPARCDSTAALRRLSPVGEFFRCKSARQNKDIHFTQKVKKSQRNIYKSKTQKLNKNLYIKKN